MLSPKVHLAEDVSVLRVGFRAAVRHETSHYEWDAYPCKGAGNALFHSVISRNGGKQYSL